MQNIILTIHLILALALIVVVLLQRSEGGGLGIGGGGGGGIMTGRGAATALAKTTWLLGTAFVITSITLTILAARDGGGGSVLDRLGIDAPLGDTELPGIDTLAPAPAPAPAPATSGDGPATPPPAQ